jgi:hypothetical protein
MIQTVNLFSELNNQSIPDSTGKRFPGLLRFIKRQNIQVYCWVDFTLMVQTMKKMPLAMALHPGIE